MEWELIAFYAVIAVAFVIGLSAYGT